MRFLESCDSSSTFTTTSSLDCVCTSLSVTTSVPSFAEVSFHDATDVHGVAGLTRQRERDEACVSGTVALGKVGDQVWCIPLLDRAFEQGLPVHEDVVYRVGLIIRQLFDDLFPAGRVLVGPTTYMKWAG